MNDNFRIVLDPGHGGKDSGAIGPGGTKEKDVVLAISHLVVSRLAEKGYITHMTRKNDDFMELADRAAFANANNADLFISIHANASTNPLANGTETFYYPNSVNGRKLATKIHNNLIKLDLKDRGVKTANFAVLRLTKMPAVLVEVGFISHYTEEKQLNSIEFQISVADAIADGILAYRGGE